MEAERIAKEKADELKRIEMFNRIMNSSKTVSKTEVDKFKDIYDEGDDVKRIEDLEN